MINRFLIALKKIYFDEISESALKGLRARFTEKRKNDFISIIQTFLKNQFRSAQKGKKEKIL